ncbi:MULTISPECIES: MarR family winged helix-turn-helix transcriptional regulator [unclassified Sphingobium]|uniref:MarR family winged helix-turn-helix transcriptional regulator n=1 Tax=unclassified Sphingobium TaxID=2611147 RepID=UPI0015E6AA88|nr:MULTISPECIES: MarR family transcriptional regulator [unclassified Sphingobium]MBG6116385.1 DNA-binding MarR family transcriptional regulator [Sphingobium sp. JAI105]
MSDTFGFLARAAQLQTFRAFYREFKDVGLTPPSYAALAIIGSNPGVRQGFVASLLGFREPNMTKLVKELTLAGLLDRVRREDDKRATGLELTEKGRIFVAEMNSRALELDQLYTQGLKKGERETLLRLLKTVLKNKALEVAEIVEFHD